MLPESTAQMRPSPRVSTYIYLGGTCYSTLFGEGPVLSNSSDCIQSVHGVYFTSSCVSRTILAKFGGLLEPPKRRGS